MPGTAGPNLGVTWGYSPGEDGWGVGGYNPGMAQLDTIVHLAVISITSTPPGSPANGDRYIVGAAATGAWTGEDEHVAVYLTTGTPGWVFYIPKAGWKAWNIATNETLLYNGADWISDTPALFNITGLADNDILQAEGGEFINVRPRHTIGFGGDPTALLTADQIVLNYRFPCGVTFLDDFADYRDWSTSFGATADATADVVLRVFKAVAATPLTFAAVGTITVGAGGIDITAKATTGGDLVFAKHDIIQILAPTVPDGTYAGLFGTLVGFET